MTQFHIVGYRHSKVFAEQAYNPLKQAPITIRGTNSISIQHFSVAARARLGACLIKMLETEYRMGDNILLKSIPPQAAVEALSAQITAYIHDEYPFNRVLGEDEQPLDWWSIIQQNHLGNVIGVWMKSFFALANL